MSSKHIKFLIAVVIILGAIWLVVDKNKQEVADVGEKKEQVEEVTYTNYSGLGVSLRAPSEYFIFDLNSRIYIRKGDKAIAPDGDIVATFTQIEKFENSTIQGRIELLAQKQNPDVGELQFGRNKYSTVSYNDVFLGVDRTAYLVELYGNVYVFQFNNEDIGIVEEVLTSFSVDK